MKLAKLLTLITLPWVLTACDVSTKSDRILLTEPQKALIQKCVGPVSLPKTGGITRAQAEALWGRDRKNLAVCRDRHAALAAWLKARDDALRGR